MNIRGLYPKCDQSKIPYLSDLASKTNAPFICLTETHLNPTILDAEISINGYDLFRSDRLERFHGGVAVYVRKDLAVKTFMRDSNSYCDSIILHVPQLNLVLISIGHQTVQKYFSIKLWSMQAASLEIWKLITSMQIHILFLGTLTFPS